MKSGILTLIVAYLILYFTDYYSITKRASKVWCRNLLADGHWIYYAVAPGIKEGCDEVLSRKDFFTETTEYTIQ